jgi:pyruvate/2-oxoglutarate dehydrogenase complex dihydrolipoamide dehydrogenase (E3) component
MEKKHYKNLIIGFGKGGKTLAKFLATKNEEVALIEKSKRMYGGTCINIGCIPSKSLIVNGENVMSFENAAIKKQVLIDKLNKKNYHMIADEQNAEVIDGTARFISDYEIEVIGADGNVTQQISAERIFINTGSIAVMPELDGIKNNEHVITSTEFLDLKQRPDHIVILGSGYIGLEFASMMS